MAIPVGTTALEYYNEQINLLVEARDRYMVYDQDWNSATPIPDSFKTVIKNKFDTVITNVKLALDDVNAVIQARP